MPNVSLLDWSLLCPYGVFAFHYGSQMKLFFFLFIVPGHRSIFAAATSMRSICVPFPFLFRPSTPSTGPIAFHFRLIKGETCLNRFMAQFHFRVAQFYLRVIFVSGVSLSFHFRVKFRGIRFIERNDGPGPSGPRPYADTPPAASCYPLQSRSCVATSLAVMPSLFIRARTAWR